MDLRGAVVVVTGAAGGIGAATTRAFASAGAKVIAADLDGDSLLAVAEETAATPVVCDVADPAHASKLVDAAIGEHGRVDVIIANAGIGHAGPFVDMDPDRLDRLVDVNIRAPLRLAHAALPGMVEQGRGSIVFVTSIAGTLLVPRESVYSATKAAVEAFAEPLREELRGTGIAVTTVLPSVVATAFFDSRGEPYHRKRPRPIPPERVADAIVDAVRRPRPQVVVPAWFRLPMRVRSVAPRVYKVLARRFG